MAPPSARVWTVPNVLSFLRLATVPVFVWLFLSGRENAGVLLYGIAAWTDFFDGYIARRTGQVTDLGKLLDPVADRVFIVALAVMLIARGTLPWWLGAAIIGRDVLVAIAFPLLERRGVERIQVNFVGKSATASLLIGLTWLAYSETTWPGRGFADEVGIGFVVWGALLYWVAAVLYSREARGKLREMEQR